MDDHHLRSILLNLHSRLSDNDRERLHFYLQNDVPRPLVDDSSLSGTLKLMQSLFDQDKINENDFTFLINAFERIRCFDAANLLKDYQRRMQVDGCVQSTQSLVSMMPAIIDELISDCEDDKYRGDQINLKQFDKNISVSLDTQLSCSSEKKTCWTCFRTKKCLFAFYILFGLTLTVLIVLAVGGMKRIHTLEDLLRVRENLIVNNPNRNDQNVTQLTYLLEQKNAAIENLNKSFNELQKLTRTSLIKAGKRIGGDGGRSFDDSLLPFFGYTNYLSGITLCTSGKLFGFQFIYRSLENNTQSVIESTVHGLYGVQIDSKLKYNLDQDERVVKVLLKSGDILFSTPDDTRFTAKVVAGLEFITTKGRRIPPGILLEDDEIEYEGFPGYTLGYATGRSGLVIDQLQFYWYRTTRQ